MYLIEILHQTTTGALTRHPKLGCILSKFYIKPQLLSDDARDDVSCILSKFYIKPQHLRGANLRGASCILSKFYIKPQRRYNLLPDCLRCILSKFYIKPQPIPLARKQDGVVSYRNSTSNHNFHAGRLYMLCVVSYRNSTSNHNVQVGFAQVGFVVSYRNSTSNHNDRLHRKGDATVVSYRNSTSNHNSLQVRWTTTALYLIEILHQTTTCVVGFLAIYGCILSKFYIKPQRSFPRFQLIPGCILSKFYIKPQPKSDTYTGRGVVSYRNSTSNHNFNHSANPPNMLYLIEILHQTTTKAKLPKYRPTLYLIEILHQTTTGAVQFFLFDCCILSKFYIKPQPEEMTKHTNTGCILSKFYIKPQRGPRK